MKLATVLLDGKELLAAVRPEDSTAAVMPGSVDDIVRGGCVDFDFAERLPLSAVELTAPLRRFNRDILCTGWNYWDHFDESKGKREGQDPAERPKHPTFFTKGPGTVIGPYDDIAHDPAISTKWDYEAEVALVIGKDGRSIPEEHAWEHVFGFCVANDVSQRDLQRRHGGQWLKGKSIDGTMPLGPWITTLDEIDDPYDLTIRCDVNRVTLQQASTRQVAFRFERIIAELSWGMTLRAGDVILTGTPSGIGNAREPQVFLQPGDEVVTAVSGLGELRNRVLNTVSLSTPW
ncbi:2-keto-4-pentenoate hydratase/2-oxohepta-3-ene-1,7-dioic acid hydratase in catechol pathway [Kibdelosporangium banguiense]|uniref:2-keto-4-pentenoate hydratase/2-oxohepta-3-ene-1,7-dioic acid hydratase in catechol pathway n=1 Tax=Kibdelosporangium banguiense TaxID=1365924 RepID=A0ABS4TU12_9PSEU|nr:fumarylacetoacetate hydrolase family protein [Kibdelosporangium banguiense]MBP2327885.1 2-keto-4-pentenoate hydratase/2-oxohepta-3-ene-1,7-dioic acid hydratase in catechol pathway [Kibdelosporangium banguiense]